MILTKCSEENHGSQLTQWSGSARHALPRLSGKSSPPVFSWRLCRTSTVENPAEFPGAREFYTWRFPCQAEMFSVHRSAGPRCHATKRKRTFVRPGRDPERNCTRHSSPPDAKG